MGLFFVPGILIPGLHVTSLGNKVAYYYNGGSLTIHLMVRDRRPIGRPTSEQTLSDKTCLTRAPLHRSISLADRPRGVPYPDPIGGISRAPTLQAG